MPSVIIAFFAPLAFLLAGTNYLQKRQAERKSQNLDRIANDLSRFINEGERLLARRSEDPLPIQDHNNWVEHIEGYLRKNLDESYIVRLNNHSGLVSYGDGSERSMFRVYIERRTRRLHEFISEINQRRNN